MIRNTDKPGVSKVQKFIFYGLAVLCLTPVVSPPLALLLGIVFVLIFDTGVLKNSQTTVSFLLKASVVGLGFGMNMNTALKVGSEGFLFTVFSIFGTLTAGFLIGRLLKVEKVTSFLISGGTAICGGSAIAALSPVIRAKQDQISVALGVLNSAALLIFPFVGDLLKLSQTDFGMWCAIAIHDTSSVVGAAAKYGDRALEVATTVKLARALWIIPVALLSSILFRNRTAKISIPYFIGLFVLAVLGSTYIPAISLVSPYIVTASKTGLTLTLFLIGTQLSVGMLKTVGVSPVFQGVLLWLLISVTALLVILFL